MLTGTSSQDLDSEVTPEEWARFDCLAARVRCVYYVVRTHQPVGVLACRCSRIPLPAERQGPPPQSASVVVARRLGNHDALKTLKIGCAADHSPSSLAQSPSSATRSPKISPSRLSSNRVFSTSALPLASLRVFLTLRARRTLNARQHRPSHVAPPRYSSVPHGPVSSQSALCHRRICWGDRRFSA